MNNNYEKPTIAFVEFSLSSSVAASCKYTGNHGDGKTCYYENGGWKVFTVGEVCNFPTDDEFCYHAPSLDTSIFSS